MNDEQEKRLNDLEGTMTQLASGFAKLAGALTKHRELIGMDRQKISMLRGAIEAQQKGLEKFASLPEQLNAVCQLVQRHAKLLAHLAGTREPDRSKVLN